jgi:hypothetical protein
MNNSSIYCCSKSNRIAIFLFLLLERHTFLLQMLAGYFASTTPIPPLRPTSRQYI